MYREQFNATEIKMLKTITLGEYTLSQLASEMKLSLSWTSECISHLEELGFVISDRKGLAKYIRIAQRPFCHSLLKMIIERAYLNLDWILSGSKLKILTLVIAPGYSVKEIKIRSGLSSKTIYNTIKLWLGMGIIRKNGSTSSYSINPDHKYLIEFIRGYTEYRNNMMLREHFEDALIIWQKRDEFIFSIPHKIDDKRYSSSGFTRLDDFNYNIVHTSEYYKYDPTNGSTDEIEALIQSVAIDPINPRAMRSLRKTVSENNMDIEKIKEYALKYGIGSIIEKGLGKVAG